MELTSTSNVPHICIPHNYINLSSPHCNLALCNFTFWRSSNGNGNRNGKLRAPRPIVEKSGEKMLNLISFSSVLFMLAYIFFFSLLIPVHSSLHGAANLHATKLFCYIKCCSIKHFCLATFGIGHSIVYRHHHAHRAVVHVHQPNQPSGGRGLKKWAVRNVANFIIVFRVSLSSSLFCLQFFPFNRVTFVFT